MENEKIKSRPGKVMGKKIWQSRGGDIDITMSGRKSASRFQTISQKPLAGLFSYYIHLYTHPLEGCRCAFWGYDF